MQLMSIFVLSLRFNNKCWPENKARENCLHHRPGRKETVRRKWIPGFLPKCTPPWPKGLPLHKKVKEERVISEHKNIYKCLLLY